MGSSSRAAIVAAAKKNEQLRPSYHFLAPYGWMNDPCAPGYDPRTQLYHLLYQWNPDDTEWGNISWGHSVSRDLIHWMRVGESPVLEPDTEYDRKGVFTGCFFPSGLQGNKDEIAVIYTSVCHLPIHWTISYQRGAEGVSVAVSKDGGKSFTKYSKNPIVPEEPPGLHVTGWRDPFVCEWPTIDRLRCEDTGTGLYGLVSGGVHEKGPTTFLYSIDRDDLTHWIYLGPLLDFPLNFRPSQKWSGDFGANLECTNFMTLHSEKSAREFLITGSEGGRERDWVERGYTSSAVPRRVTRYCLWFSGSLHNNEGSIRMEYDFGGLLDHGIFYAANSFHDPVKDRRVVWGWLIEEDVSTAFRRAKGWSGSLGLPRELFLNVIPNVTGALVSPISDIVSMKPVREADGSLSLHTLGIRPLPELTTLRTDKPYSLGNKTLPGIPEGFLHSLPIQSRHFELSATISIRAGCERVGVIFRHNQDFSTSVGVYFLPKLEKIVVERSKANAMPDCNRCDERGPFTLFTQLYAGEPEQLESLKLRLFVDKDVVEVYANERFALATMVYVRDNEALGVSLVGEGQTDSAVFENVTVWGMRSTQLGYCG